MDEICLEIGTQTFRPKVLVHVNVQVQIELPAWVIQKFKTSIVLGTEFLNYRTEIGLNIGNLGKSIKFNRPLQCPLALELLTQETILCKWKQKIEFPSILILLTMKAKVPSTHFCGVIEPNRNHRHAHSPFILHLYTLEEALNINQLGRKVPELRSQSGSQWLESSLQVDYGATIAMKVSSKRPN